eukprot:5002995-Amphidinium_carterae.1
MKFRMVAGRIVHLRKGPHCREQRVAEREIARNNFLAITESTQHYFSETTLLLRSHKRELPAVLEGNKPHEQQGPMTTFKNWAAKVQIYMSLEDHNMATMLEDVKTQKVAIVDANNIDYYLHEQGLGQKDEDEIREKELQKMFRVYNTRAEPILRRNAEKGSES